MTVAISNTLSLDYSNRLLHRLILFVEQVREFMSVNLRVLWLWLLAIPFVSFSGCTGKNDVRQNLSALNNDTESSVQRPQMTKNSNETEEFNSDEMKYDRVVGCWVGMRGGKLVVTRNVVTDIISHQSSDYNFQKVAPKTKKGMQTGEQYVLELDGQFSKGFLSKVVEFSFNNDETVGVISYDSYQNYLDNVIVGQGLFQKIDCERFE